MKRLTQGIISGITSLCLLSTLSAQEVEQEIQESGGVQTEMTVVAGDGFAAPMIFSTTESIDGGAMKSGVRIMSGGPGMGMGFIGDAMGGDFEMPAPDPYTLLGNPSVQKDLELVGDQLKKVQELQARFGKQMRDEIGDLSKGGLGPDRFKGIGEIMAKLREEQKRQMEKLLLPHQAERLRQVALQTHMQQTGTSNALASSEVAEALNITDKQKEELKTRAKEMNEQLAKDIAKLRQDAKDNLIKEVLTAEQQSELKKMIGAKYEPQNKDWEEHFNKATPTRRSMRFKNQN